MKWQRIFYTSVCILIAGLLTWGVGFAQTETPSSGTPVVRITQVDTSRFPQVWVYLSITDAAGEPLSIPISSLVLKENGVEITPEEIRGAGEFGSLTTLLVMDVSGSMNHGGKLQAAKRAARAYVEQARPGDRIGLISFNTEVELVQPITQDHQAVLRAIESLKAKDDTAMYDAIWNAVEQLSGVEGRNAIIVLTDGLDNRSHVSPQEILQRIGAQGLTISTIGFGDPTQSRSSLGSLDEAALQALAEQAGGVYGYAEDADSLKALYERYGRALQSEYVIVYTSPSKLRDGLNRKIEVSILEGSAEAVLQQAGKYNPGGLVPEVAQAAPWGMFLMVLSGLILLLVLPFGWSLWHRRTNGHGKGGGRIKLAPPAPRPKVRLK